MRPSKASFTVALALAGALLGPDAEARRPRVRHHPDWEKHRSTRYAALEGPACTAELARRGVAFTTVSAAPGVRAPVRLPKDVGGVVYRTEAPEHVRAASPYDVFDCRLVLALHDWSSVLLAHDIDEVRIFSAWRPVSQKVLGEGEGARHAGGLAVDVARFGKRLAAGEHERRWLVVDRDFNGRVGAEPCGPAAPPPFPATPASRELRSITCETADQHLFTSILTPGYDRAHKNHLHLELTPGVRWYLVL